MTDFNKALFFCSHLEKIMNNGTGERKLPSLRVAEAKIELAELESKYDPYATKYIDRQVRRKQKIEEQKIEIQQLELLKDEDFIPDKCKTYLSGQYSYLKYKKWSLPTGEALPHIEKGVLVEPASIEMLGRLDKKSYSKNERKFTNMYLVGIPDIIIDDYVIDVKNSYDVGTFFANLHKPLSAIYWWQMQGYFSLTGLQKGEISFCLLSNPQKTVDKVVADLMAKGTYYSEDEIRANFNYDDIPEEERRIRFLVERDDEAISKIPDRVNNCRKFLTSLEEQRTEIRIAKNVLLDQTDTENPDEVEG